MRIVSICGSPGKASLNRAALEYATGHLIAQSSDMHISDVPLDDIPIFDPRLAAEPPTAVVELGRMFDEADGVMIAAPEYAGGLAGGTKTALDWMVGLASLYHRPVVVLSAGTTGGQYAIEQLVRTLSWQGALVVDTLGITGARTKIDSSGLVSDAELAQSIERLATSLTSAISADPATLRQRVSEVISEFGIDPDRFGNL